MTNGGSGEILMDFQTMQTGIGEVKRLIGQADDLAQQLTRIHRAVMAAWPDNTGGAYTGQGNAQDVAMSAGQQFQTTLNTKLGTALETHQATLAKTTGLIQQVAAPRSA